jgi:3-deoxy-7-phosphoheptulonate synthase
MTKGWTKSDWRAKPRVQMPDYPDAALAAVEAQLAKYPPLVFAGEARRLKKQLAQAAEGKAFLLQGGDCAESFRGIFRRQHPRHLPGDAADGGGADLWRQGAGDQGGPHGRPVRQAALGADRGDRRRRIPQLPRRHHQRLRPDHGARMPDPQRMLQAYTQAAASLNLLRAFSTGGFADIHRVHSWTLGFAEHDKAERYRELANRISDALDFMNAAGVTADNRERAVRRWISTPATRRCSWNMKRRCAGSIRHRPECGRLGPHDLDRRPHPPARRRACRILPRRAEPDRAEMRADHHGR